MYGYEAKKRWKPNTKVISGGQKVRQNKQQITVYYSVYGFKRYKSNTQSTHLHSHTYASTEHYTPRIIFVSICRNCCFYMPQFPLLFSVWLLPVFFACRFLCIFVYVGTSVFVCQIKSHHQQTTRGKEDRTAATAAAASISVFRLFLSFVHAWIVANFLAPNCIRRFVCPKKCTTEIWVEGQIVSRNRFVQQQQNEESTIFIEKVKIDTQNENEIKSKVDKVAGMFGVIIQWSASECCLWWVWVFVFARVWVSARVWVWGKSSVKNWLRTKRCYFPLSEKKQQCEMILLGKFFFFSWPKRKIHFWCNKNP